MFRNIYMYKLLFKELGRVCIKFKLWRKNAYAGLGACGVRGEAMQLAAYTDVVTLHQPVTRPMKLIG